MKKQKILILIFVLLLTIPSVLQWLGAFPQSNTENRVLAELPSFQEARNMSLQELQNAYSDYYSDHTPMKSQFVGMNAGAEFPFNTLISEFELLSTEESVLVGEENWLYYFASIPSNREDSVREYTGENLPTEEELLEYAADFQSVYERMAQDECEVILLIAPGKEQVYDQFMPGVLTQGERTRADILAEYLNEHTDFRVVYPLAYLKEKSKDYLTFRKYDTHWNMLGGFYGEQAILTGLGYEEASEDTYFIYDFAAETDGDLVNLLGLSSMPESPMYVASSYRDEEVEMLTDERDGTVRHTTSTARNEKTVLLIGDSFADAISDYLYKDFSDVYYVSKDLMTAKSLYSEINPDLVIFESVERVQGRIKDYSTFFSQ